MIARAGLELLLDVGRARSSAVRVRRPRPGRPARTWSPASTASGPDVAARRSRSASAAAPRRSQGLPRSVPARRASGRSVHGRAAGGPPRPARRTAPSASRQDSSARLRLVRATARPRPSSNRARSSCGPLALRHLLLERLPGGDRLVAALVLPGSSARSSQPRPAGRSRPVGNWCATSAGWTAWRRAWARRAVSDSGRYSTHGSAVSVARIISAADASSRCAASNAPPAPALARPAPRPVARPVRRPPAAAGSSARRRPCSAPAMPRPRTPSPRTATADRSSSARCRSISSTALVSLPVRARNTTWSACSLSSPSPARWIR